MGHFGLIVSLVILHVFLLPVDTVVMSPDDCEIQNVEGFLQYVCVDNNEQTAFKCINTDQFFHVKWRPRGRSGMVTVDVLCDVDSNFYQACATHALMKEKNIDQNGRHLPSLAGASILPCGYFCQMNGSEAVLSRFDNLFACDTDENCVNTGIDEAICGSRKNLVPCNLMCDVEHPHETLCEDESSCNGFHYGLWCDNHLRYVLPRDICDGKQLCEDGADENRCQINMETTITCKRHGSGIRIPLFNYTRCGPILETNLNLLIYKADIKTTTKLCDDFLDQTNCSDHSRVGLYCPVRGYISTVAERLICGSGEFLDIAIPAICDDNLDRACIKTSFSCLVHKHQLCDGLVDCEDKSDEKQDLCQDMADKNCRRRFVYGHSKRSFAIPMGWVQDGTTDCQDGEDEIASWPTCGLGPTIRFKNRLNDSCSEVFLCYGTNQFIHFSMLCDKIPSCGNENQICEQSRYQPTVFNKAFREDLNKVTLSYCLKGLGDIERLTGKNCIQHKFVSPQKQIFGKNNSLDIRMPSSQEDCRHYYGDLYLFLSCLGHCKSSLCPLDTVRHIKIDPCPAQFSKVKVFTIDSHGNLTFLIKNPKSGLLGYDFFPCASSQKCLTYEKLCNLVDDCGDGSDEDLCDNHFQCTTTKNYIHVSQKCDQVIHCADISDECNESCGKTIISGIGLEIMAWTIGILAIVLNVNAIIKNATSLRACKSEAAFFTNSLVVLISFGDFLFGVYLTVLAVLDRFYGQRHCTLQMEWLTSRACIVLGITSTLGSQLSLLSMAILSTIRTFGVRNINTTHEEVTRKSVMKVILLASLIILLCTLIACIPMLEIFEEYFVNGIKYDDSNSLFVGFVDKKRHTTILKEYYGRMKLIGDHLTWSQIRHLVRAMFSSDYGGIKQTKRSFYGNDHVCVFKYLVRIEDSQRNYTVILLTINFLCFAVITVAYGTIAARSRKSITALTADNLSSSNPTSRETDARLRRVIHAIIISDFLCWMPFTVICFLHLFSALDATPWYPLFSILVLPINSVFNPILYDKSIMRTLDCAFVKGKSKFLMQFYRIRSFMRDSLWQKDESNNNFEAATVPEQEKNSNISGGATVPI